MLCCGGVSPRRRQVELCTNGTEGVHLTHTIPDSVAEGKDLDDWHVSEIAVALECVSYNFLL